MIVVDIAFSTGLVEPSERLPAWRELVSRVFLPLTITPLSPGEFDGSVTGSDWGELRVWRVTASPMAAVRAARHLRLSACDDYLLAVHVSSAAASTIVLRPRCVHVRSTG